MAKTFDEVKQDSEGRPLISGPIMEVLGGDEAVYEPNDVVRLISTLIKERQAQGLTQAELARRCGWEPDNITRFERGAHVPRLDKVIRVAHALGLTVELARRPNAETVEALFESEEMLAHPERYEWYDSVEELRKALDV